MSYNCMRPGRFIVDSGKQKKILDFYNVKFLDSETGHHTYRQARRDLNSERVPASLLSHATPTLLQRQDPSVAC